MVEKIIIYARDILPAIGFLISLLIFICKQSKSRKAQKVAANLLFINERVREAIVLAEDYINYSGSDKKEWVITKVVEACLENNVTYSREAISEVIEACINLSKQVNATEAKQKEVAAKAQVNCVK